MGRWMGVDYGIRRIGVALGDPGEQIASPVETLEATGTASGNVTTVLRWAADNDVDAIVVGLPLNMDGTDSKQTRLVRAFVAKLRDASPLPVALWDERLTSFQADQALATMDVRRRRRRPLRDALAAQVILQAFLDARRST